MKFLEEQLGDVLAFHLKVTGMPMPDVPTMLTYVRLDKGLVHLHEELAEFEKATTIGDQADALVDLIYVAMGRLLEMGIKPGPAFKLVHAQNMLKVRGANKRGDQFEAAKPPGWTPPDWETHLGLEKKGEYIGLKRASNPWDGASTPCGKKILLLGYGRHGKDTVAEMLRDDYGYSFTSSSMACAEKVMLPHFRMLREAYVNCKIDERGKFDLPPIYADALECYNDRHNHRATWFKAIEAFNTPDKAALGKMIFEGYDIYCGLRSAREFAAVKNSGLYDVCIWVDATARGVPVESRDSCTVEPWMADYVLDNNGSIDELRFNLKQLMENSVA